jgi:hypothetical protein
MRDEQFVFDFDKYLTGEDKNKSIVAANRRTFPALVSTGSGMSVGRIGRKLNPIKFFESRRQEG